MAPNRDIPLENEQAQSASEIVIVGVRGAQIRSLEIKRNASQIVDSVVAEDIGRLPDVTITDSLQRVTGVQISRVAGEGATVNVRGLSQVQTTLNGEQFLGSLNVITTQPDFSDVPAALIASVDVLKSARADQLEGGISGTVDLKSRRPLDLRRGWTVAANAEGSYGDLSKAYNPLGSALVGYRSADGRLGLLASVQASRARLANFNSGFFNNQYDRITDADVRFDITGNGRCATRVACLTANDYVFLPRQFGINTQQTRRDRQALNLSAQYRLTDRLTATGDYFGTRIQQSSEANDVYFHNNGSLDALQAQDLVVSPNNVVTLARGNSPRLFNRAITERLRGRADNFNVQLDYDDGERFSLTSRYVHGENDQNRTSGQADSDYNPLGRLVTAADGTRQYVSPATNTSTNVAARYLVDSRGGLPVFTFLDGAPDPARVAINSVNVRGAVNRSRLDVFRLDGAVRFEDSIVTKASFGARGGSRAFTSDAFAYLMRYRAGDPDSALTRYGNPLLPRDGDFYAQFGPAVLANLPADLRTTLTGAGGIGDLPAGGIPAVDPAGIRKPVAFLQRLFPLSATYPIPEASYRVAEDVREFYGQVDAETRLGGIDLSGNAGLRYVRTHLNIAQNVTSSNRQLGGLLIDLGDIVTDRSFDDFLPTVNLRAALTPELILRLGYNKAIARPDLDRLGRGLVQGFTANQNQYPNLPPLLPITTGGTAGNPDLDPYRTSNYNASLEWYFSRDALVNAAAFVIDVASFPGRRSAQEALPDGDGVVRAGGTVTRDFNAGGGKIRGFEVGFQQAFTFLPGVLSGFGTQANYTYVTSKLSTPQLDFRDRPLPFPDLSRHQANAILYYQKYGIQGRVAGNYRSRRFSQLSERNNVGVAASAIPGTTALSNLAVYYMPTFYLDASLSYDLNEHATIYVQGSNLTGEREQRYAQFKELFWDASLFDRRYTVGVRVRL